MSPRSLSLPVMPSLERHPDDGFQLAEPLPMSAWSQRALRGVVDAVLPPTPAPRVPGVEDEVALHVRRMLQYMPTGLRLGFVLLLHVLDWSPIFRFRAWLPVHALSAARGSALLAELSNSRLLPIRLLMLAPKACILSTYFDRDEVHQALRYDPRAFMRDRVERRRALLSARGTSDLHREAREYGDGDDTALADGLGSERVREGVESRLTGVAS